MNYQEEMNRCKILLEQRLSDFFAENIGLQQAMRYSLLAGGKRIRPVLTLQFCKALGGDLVAAMDCACAVEMLHTYSLIHDDLPCMDDDELRRGRPTCHKAFGEWQALLAGDALQAEAFGTILRSTLPADRQVACARILAEAAGAQGICLGQYLDLDGEGKSLTERELTEIHRGKTASLLRASCQIGVAAAGGDQTARTAADQYGGYLGLAFQIRDDMLDELSTVEELGKPIGSDRTEGKTTFFTLYGKDKCQKMVDELTQKAKDGLRDIPQPEFLCWLADELAGRSS